MKNEANKLFLVVFSLFLFLIASSAYAACGHDEKSNIKVVSTFYNLAINDKNFNAASKYLGSRYTQHNPTAEDGPEGLRKFIKFLREKYPKAHSEIKRVFSDGDFVILHIHSVRVPGTRGRAIIDIFRLKKHKIVEHWDVIQNIPGKSANSNTMF